MSSLLVEKPLKNGEKQTYWRLKIIIYSAGHMANIVRYMNKEFGHGRQNWRMTKGLRKHGETPDRRYAMLNAKTLFVNCDSLLNSRDAVSLSVFLTLLPEE